MTRQEYRAGGARQSAKRGVELPHAKLTPETVAYVRSNPKGLPRWKLAEQLGVHIRTVEKAARYESWSHI